MGVVRRHGSGYMADVRVGERRQRKVFATREEAEKTAREWEAEAKASPEQQRRRELAGPTMGDVFDGWIAYKAARTSKPSSLRNARESVRCLARYFRRSSPASAVTGRDVDRMIASYRERGCRPATINHDLRALKAALRWAADPDRGALLDRLPLRVQLVSEPKINGATVRRLLITDEQLARLLDVSEPKLRAIFALCAFAGLRRDEALHLKVGDIDLSRGVVFVCEKPEADWSPKTHQEREVEFGPRLRVELARYLATLKERERAGDAWLFTSQLNRGERLQQIAPQVKRAYKRAGIKVPRGGTHTLRKVWASKAGELGDIEALRELGGWASWSAMRHYVSASAAARRRIAEKF